jgi:putative heme-binding domain-containing protein
LLSLLGPEKEREWNSVINNARTVALNKQANENYRVDALGLLALDKNTNDKSSLEQLITPEESEPVQEAALRTYNQVSSKDAGVCVIRKWKTLAPNVREVAIGVMLSSDENMNMLLDAVQKEQVQATAISWPRKVYLMNNDNIAIRSRARNLLATEKEDRSAVYKRYEPALVTNGDAKNGLVVFQRVCSACHVVGGQFGKAFGPDLASIRNRDAQFIMADILDPNRSIADKYEMWTITKKNGEKLNGIIAAETPTTITLSNIGASHMIISRGEIKTMESSETSAMPTGLEASVSIKEMRDLLAFLKGVHQ